MNDYKGNLGEDYSFKKQFERIVYTGNILLGNNKKYRNLDFEDVENFIYFFCLAVSSIKDWLENSNLKYKIFKEIDIIYDLYSTKEKEKRQKIINKEQTKEKILLDNIGVYINQADTIANKFKHANTTYSIHLERGNPKKKIKSLRIFIEPFSLNTHFEPSQIEFLHNSNVCENCVNLKEQLVLKEKEIINLKFEITNLKNISKQKLNFESQKIIFYDNKKNNFNQQELVRKCFSEFRVFFENLLKQNITEIKLDGSNEVVLVEDLIDSLK